MYLTQLSLVNFRSHNSLNLEFSSGITCLLGNNGEGKTNVVEALYFLANQESHRVASNQPLINKDSSIAKISGNFLINQTPLQLEIELTSTKGSTAWVNKNPVKNREALGLAQVIIFAPEDLEILRRDPGDRRYFLDQSATILNPRVAGVRSDYERVLKQRNSLLKSASMLSGKAQQTAVSTIDVWNERLIQLAAELILLRLALLDQLIPLVNNYYQQIAPNNLFEYQYQPSWSEKELKLETDWIQAELTQAISENSAEEIKRGVTLVGPHRDEILFKLNQLPIKGYASHGETWSAALSLKLGLLHLLQTAVNTVSTPILVLDDVFAELDDKRREQLMQIALGIEQTIITAAAEVDLPSNLAAKIYRFSGGVITGD
ncbi:MAG: DNA replication/repair protein RecF [Candidatus Nanopelagicales bacterium]